MAVFFSFCHEIVYLCYSSSSVVDELRRKALSSGPSQAVAYFYIDRLSASHQGLNQLISAFLRQLLQQLPKLPLDIIRIFQRNGAYGGKLTYAELVEQLISVARQFRQVYLCFDGLDELADKEQQSLLGLFERFSKVDICVFVTSSRFTHQLHTLFQRPLSEPDSLYALIIYQTEEYAEDVTRYVQLRVLLSVPPKGGFKLPEQIIRKIIALSKEMSVHSQLKSLSRFMT